MRKNTDATPSSPAQPATKIHAFGDDALGDHDAVGLLALLKKGTVSAAELSQAAIQRAQAVNPQLQAIQLDYFAAGGKPAAPAHQHAPFAGIPTFIKDNLDIAGSPTNLGSNAFSAKVAKATDPYAAQFLAQGFTLLGKTRMPEFGLNGSNEYKGSEPTHNPWHLGHTPGGSSGGAAALVAAGVVPIAHGNDGGGSIRIPAACCGLVGLKPTRGRHINSLAARVLPINIVSEGVLTRSVRDTAHFHAAMERSYSNPKLKPVGLVEGAGKRRLRIAVAYDSVVYPSDAETRAAVRATAEALAAAGHHVHEIQIPITAQFADDFTLYWGMLAFIMTHAGRLLADGRFDRSRLDNLTLGLAAQYRQTYRNTPAALYRLHQSARDYSRMFLHYDVMLSPVLGITPPPLGYLSPAQPFDDVFDHLQRYACFTPYNNASGSPAISLPTGMSSGGLPIGSQLAAQHGEERMLLELAFELEQLMPWQRIQGA